MTNQSPIVWTRRTLLAALSGALGLAGSSAGAGKPAPARRPLTLLETFVAGTAYYEARRVRRGLRPGDLLVLRREPDNPYDDLAIEVFTHAGAKLGYVPRADNEPFARLLDAGNALKASVIDVDPDRYDDIHMRLTLRIA